MVTMTEQVTEVRCKRPRRIAGKDQRCNELLLRLPSDLMGVMDEFYSETGKRPYWWCDKCHKEADVETILT